MPKSSKNILSKLKQTANSLLQVSKSSSKIVKDMSFMKENSKQEIRKCLKLSSLKRIPSCSKIGSKKII